MTDLFDLPFEDDDDGPVRRQPFERPTTDDAERRRQPPAPPAAPTRRVLTVTELTVRVRDLLETEFFEVWVEGELSNCRVWNTGHLYFTLKDGAAQITAVMFRSALRYLKFKPADGLRVVARGRVSRLRAEGRVSARLRAPRAARARRAAARLRAAEEAAAGRRAVRRRRASGRCRRCRARSASSPRSTARRCATSSRCCAAATPNAHLVIRPARVQGEGAAAEIARGAASDRHACRASTSSSSAAAADRSRISGRSTRRSSRARSPRRRCR